MPTKLIFQSREGRTSSFTIGYVCKFKDKEITILFSCRSRYEKNVDSMNNHGGLKTFFWNCFGIKISFSEEVNIFWKRIYFPHGSGLNDAKYLKYVKKNTSCFFTEVGTEYIQRYVYVSIKISKILTRIAIIPTPYLL